MKASDASSEKLFNTVLINKGAWQSSGLRVAGFAGKVMPPSLVVCGPKIPPRYLLNIPGFRMTNK
ncbi:hypothetical protein U0070_012696 [Myodes glareolus]|uniref:Uncharacterized protein n=1 Tax=Myodes glareolus TaxID=447135 RepID=A0AAW0JRZ7_MYOGA